MTPDQIHRQATFNWLRAQVDLLGDVLPRTLLTAGFEVAGERVHLMGPQGIFTPRMMTWPISITTSPKGPYTDTLDGDLLGYKYRGSDPLHRDNVGLREAMRRHVPLVHFHGLVPGRYLAAWPIYIVGDDPESLTFTADLQPGMSQARGQGDEVADRVYSSVTYRRRLHQRTFRERVLRAYRDQCSVCRLRHRELLDASHIIPDSEVEGQPFVRNGLALCKIHHAAYDSNILGVSPDYVVTIREDILMEVDGPMLRHGLQDMNGESIVVPSKKAERPDRDRLATRYEHFLKAS